MQKSLENEMELWTRPSIHVSYKHIISSFIIQDKSARFEKPWIFQKKIFKRREEAHGIFECEVESWYPFLGRRTRGESA